jgi:excisionase family DNA binding protein
MANTINKTQKEELKGIPTNADDPILNLSTVADALGKSPTTIGRWIEEGVIPHIRMPNGLAKVRRSQLVDWLGTTAIGEDKDLCKRVSELSEVA